MATAAELNIIIKAQTDADKVLKGIAAQLGSLDKAAGQAGKSAGGLSTAFSGISGAVAGATKALGAVGLAAAGIDAVAGAAKNAAGSLGVGLASEAEQTRARFKAFIPDAGELEKVLGQVRAEADKTPFGFAEMSKAVASLIPSARQAKEPLIDLTRTAEVLAAANPAEGLEGAAFALREAVSGDFTSIIERFDLPRSTINKLKEQGLPALEIVRQAMGEMGYSMDLVGNLAQTTEGRFSTFNDALDGLKQKAGQPILDALGRGLDKAAQALEENREPLERFATAVGQTLANAIDFGVGAVQRIIQIAQELGPIFQRAGDAIGDVLRGDFGAAFEDAKALAGDLGSALGDRLSGAVSVVQGAFADLAPTGERVGAMFGRIGEFLGEAIPRVLEFVGGVVETVQQSGVLEGALQAVGGAINAVSGFIEGTILPVVGALADRFGSFASEVAPLVASAFESIQNIVGTVLGAVGSLIQSNLALFQAQWAEHGATVQTIVGAVWGALSGIVEAGLTVIGGTIKTILAIISGDWSTAWQTMITTATTALGQLAGAIGALAGPIGAKAAEIGTAIVQGIGNGIRGGLASVQQAAAGVAQAALSAAKAQLGIASPSKEFEDVGEDVVAGLVQGIESVAGDAVAAVEDMVAEMQDATVGFNLVDSILGGLDTKGQDGLANFLRDSENVIEDVGRKAQEVGEKTARAIADAREDAARAIEDVREGAAGRALELVDNQGLSREIRAVRERFGEQQDEAERAYDRQREDADATYKYERDLAKAKTDDEKAEVRARFKEAQADLARRRDQEEADRAFKKQQNADLQAFNDRLEDEALQRTIKRLQEERDRRITEIEAALGEKERKTLENEARERAALAQSASDKLNDLKERFFDKVGPLTEETRAKFEELFKGLATQVGDAAKAVNDLAAALSKAAGVKVGGLTNAPSAGQSTWENQTQAVRDMFTAAYGSNAKQRWQEEHAAELGVAVGTTTGGGGGGSSAPSQTSDVHAAGFDWGAYNAANQGKPRNPDGTVKNAYGDHPLAAGQASWVGETGWPEMFVPNTAGRLVTQDQMAMAVGGGQHGGGAVGELCVYLEIDGQTFARATAPYTAGALDQMVRLKLG